MPPCKSPVCLRHSYKFFTINDRLSLQGNGTIPNSFVSIEQSITELNGLLAGVGYSAVVTGITFFTANESYCPASSNIFSAKPCHVVSSRATEVISSPGTIMFSINMFCNCQDGLGKIGCTGGTAILIGYDS